MVLGVLVMVTNQLVTNQLLILALKTVASKHPNNVAAMYATYIHDVHVA